MGHCAISRIALAKSVVPSEAAFGLPEELRLEHDSCSHSSILQRRRHKDGVPRYSADYQQRYATILTEAFQQ